MTAQAQQYRAAIYLRVSREDHDKEQSNSIVNQRLLIEDYISAKPEIIICQEQVDDGYSGTDFDRPGFISMMESVKTGEVNCIVVKDLSRFGRNYIETGRYIEQIFPFLGLRFIAINDGFDSLYRNNTTDNILIPFKNLINDAYSRDISIKIQSQLDIKRKKGEFIGAFAPYGYLKQADNKNKLVIDPYAALVVHRVFCMKLQGLSNAKIADKLNSCNIYSPADYKKAGGGAYSSGFQVYSTARWTAVSVGRILKSAVYIGNMQQGKSYSPSFRGGRRRAVPPDDWISAEGTHEPIVSDEQYQAVQKLLMQDTRASPNKEQLYPLSGLMLCADCGQPMVRKTVGAKDKQYSYYVCSSHKADKTLCSSHRISADGVEKAIELIIHNHVRLIGGVPVSKLPNEQPTVAAAQQSFTAQEKQRYTQLLAGVYEDYKQGLLDDEDYHLLTNTYKQKLADLKAGEKHTFSVMLTQTHNLERISTAKQLGNTEEEAICHMSLGSPIVLDKAQLNSEGKMPEGTNDNNNITLTRLMAVQLIRNICVWEGGRIQVALAYSCPHEAEII